jgi:hypothetical protein
VAHGRPAPTCLTRQGVERHAVIGDLLRALDLPPEGAPIVRQPGYFLPREVRGRFVRLSCHYGRKSRGR